MLTRGHVVVTDKGLHHILRHLAQHTDTRMENSTWPASCNALGKGKEKGFTCYNRAPHPKDTLCSAGRNSTSEQNPRGRTPQHSDQGTAHGPLSCPRQRIHMPERSASQVRLRGGGGWGEGYQGGDPVRHGFCPETGKSSPQLRI